MRYVRTVVIPREGWLHPIDRKLAEEPSVTRELLHNISLLDDGTAIVLYQLTGDVDRLEAIGDSPEIIDYHLSANDDRITVYAHFEANDTVRELLTLFREHELVLDMPLEYTARGGLRATIIGDESVIREVIPKAPDGVAFNLEQIGDYEPEEERLFSMLTKRQQETLKAALEVGYYRVPREATHKDIAEYLDRSDGTVGEHLRKIEAKVMTAISP